MENYKEIPNYPNYAISRRAEVKNLRTGKILKPGMSNDRHVVGLYTDGIRKVFGVHMLMAMTYLDHTPNGTHILVVDHINNDPFDNSLENLQLIPQRQNTSKDKVSKYGLPTGVQLHHGKKYQAKIQINGKRIVLGSFSTIEEASEAYQNAISKL